MVRFGAIGLGLLFFTWLVALVTGVSGFGGLPALDVGGSGGRAILPMARPATTAKPPASPSDTSPSQAKNEATTNFPSEGAAPAPSGSTSTGTAATVRGDNGSAGSGIWSVGRATRRTTHGRPARTPSGKVPGARANGGNRRAYGAGRGGGRAGIFG